MGRKEFFFKVRIVKFKIYFLVKFDKEFSILIFIFLIFIMVVFKIYRWVIFFLKNMDFLFEYSGENKKDSFMKY